MDEGGAPSSLADEFLARCWEAGGGEDSFVEECSKGMFEINALPSGTLASLSTEYLKRLSLALRVGRVMGVRLYPLAAYPLPMDPPMREDPSYELQARTLGREKFQHAGRCVGAHLHLELPEGTMDPATVVSQDASPAPRRELLDLHNLAVALDPAIIALTRSVPFYEGEAPGLAVRTARYRGSADFGWQGLYTDLPEVGGLKPYVRSVEELVERQRADYGAWLSAMRHSGVAESQYTDNGGGTLKANWGPVRLSGLGTARHRRATRHRRQLSATNPRRSLPHKSRRGAPPRRPPDRNPNPERTKVRGGRWQAPRPGLPAPGQKTLPRRSHRRRHASGRPNLPRLPNGVRRQ